MDFSILKNYKLDLLGLMAILILLFVVGCHGIYQSQTTVLGIEAVINPMSSQGPITARIGVITHRQNISQSANIKKMENSIAMYNVNLWNLEGNINGKKIAENTNSNTPINYRSCQIGYESDQAHFNGKLKNLNVSIGIARYLEDFTPVAVSNIYPPQ